MSFEIDDPCEAICEALAASYNLSTAFSFKARAALPEDPNTLLETPPSGPEVMFFPFSEQEEKIGRGGEVAETFQQTMVVRTPYSSQFSRSKFFRWVREIRRYFRGQRMAGYVYSQSETVTKLDLERLHLQHQQLSIVRFSYRGTDH